jgi:hypothetical protein
MKAAVVHEVGKSPVFADFERSAPYGHADVQLQVSLIAGQSRSSRVSNSDAWKIRLRFLSG